MAHQQFLQNQEEFKFHVARITQEFCVHIDENLTKLSTQNLHSTMNLMGSTHNEMFLHQPEAFEGPVTTYKQLGGI